VAEAKPRSLAIYRRGPAWVEGKKFRDQPTLLEHGRFVAELESTGEAIHAGPVYRLDEVPEREPIGMVSFPGEPADAAALLHDDPALISGLLQCDIVDWHV
jgi:hypothetical protein